MANGKKKRYIIIKGCLGAKLTNVFMLAPSYKIIFLPQWRHAK